MKDIVWCEFFEEIGLWVDVGLLVYVCEFVEFVVGCFYMELFYCIDVWCGELILVNLKGLGGDEFDICEVGWIVCDELFGLLFFYLVELVDDVWLCLDVLMLLICYFGLQCQMFIVLDCWWGF